MIATDVNWFLYLHHRKGKNKWIEHRPVEKYYRTQLIVNWNTGNNPSTGENFMLFISGTKLIGAHS